MAPQAQVGSGPGFDRHQGQLVEMGPFGIKKARISELGQRLAAPQAGGPRPERPTPAPARRRRPAAVPSRPAARSGRRRPRRVRRSGHSRLRVVRIAAGPRVRRSWPICVCRALAGFAACPSPHSRSISRSALTGCPRCRASRASRARCLAPRTGTGTPPASGFELAEQPDLHDLHRTAARPGSLTALTDMPEIAPASAPRQSRHRPRTQAYVPGRRGCGAVGEADRANAPAVFPGSRPYWPRRPSIRSRNRSA